MSVTFTHNAELPVTGWDVHCGEHNLGPTFGDRQDAAAYLGELRAGNVTWDACDDAICAAYGPYITPRYKVAPVEVNMSNTNAAHVLRTLGVDTTEGLYGTMPCAELAARIAAASGTYDAGEPVVVAVRTHMGVVEVSGAAAADAHPSTYAAVYGGRAQGYANARYADLEELLEQAAACGATEVDWG